MLPIKKRSYAAVDNNDNDTPSNGIAATKRQDGYYAAYTHHHDDTESSKRRRLDMEELRYNAESAIRGYEMIDELQLKLTSESLRALSECQPHTMTTSSSHERALLPNEDADGDELVKIMTPSEFDALDDDEASAVEAVLHADESRQVDVKNTPAEKRGGYCDVASMYMLANLISSTRQYYPSSSSTGGGDDCYAESLSSMTSSGTGLSSLTSAGTCVSSLTALTCHDFDNDDNDNKQIVDVGNNHSDGKKKLVIFKDEMTKMRSDMSVQQQPPSNQRQERRESYNSVDSIERPYYVVG